MMPLLSRIAVRLALVWLGLGATWGLARMLLPWATVASPVLRAATAAVAWAGVEWHADAMLFAGLTQLTLGVAYWILPRFDGGRRRGRPWAAWSALVCVNLSAILGFLHVPWNRIAAALGLAAFAWHAAPRLNRQPPPRQP